MPKRIDSRFGFSAFVVLVCLVVAVVLIGVPTISNFERSQDDPITSSRLNPSCNFSISIDAQVTKEELETLTKFLQLLPEEQQLVLETIGPDVAKADLLKAIGCFFRCLGAGILGGNAYDLCYSHCMR